MWGDDMRIIYEGVDITDKIDMRACVIEDTCDDRADLLEITFNRPQDWEMWQPQIDDEIRVTHEYLDTGTMYVTELEPTEDTYMIRANTMKLATREKRWMSWEKKTLGNIMDDCAKLCGMDWMLYGLDNGITYDYMMMDNESVPAFLRRLLRMEGAVLKCCAGRFVGIGVNYANRLEAVHRMDVESRKDTDMTQAYMPYTAWKSVTVNGYEAEGKAEDTDVQAGDSQTFFLHTRNADEAKRWAKGLLLTNNMMV